MAAMLSQDQKVTEVTMTTEQTHRDVDEMNVSVRLVKDRDRRSFGVSLSCSTTDGCAARPSLDGEEDERLVPDKTKKLIAAA
ncbi:hypothetical protein EYF80_055300 [Liparis tanakae]|uniref:Uncharacterized protein n=1 Tax=Liparis tanakae TaxID=230148 RepID=A0A4Z2F226_9TELE|nr:hypothetical protein EYF80_055300 [Liparis tanakae]